MQMTRRIAKMRPILLAFALSAFFLPAFSLPAPAQQPPVINPRIPPPPPPDAPSTPPPTAPSTAPDSARAPLPLPAKAPVTLQPPLTPLPKRNVPETVVVPAGTRMAVTLDTPLSTRISKIGQAVNFRTNEALPVGDLVIPPDTLFTGKVVEAKKPGAFGRSGTLLVEVNRIELANGTGSEVVAKIDSSDMNGHGKMRPDRSRAATLLNLALYGAQGTLIGSQIGGGKGAAIGGGAGVAVALIMMASKKGTDVYLEPGMPFEVSIEEPLSLPGKAVADVQPGNANGGSSVGPGNNDSDHANDPDYPKLKRRPKPQPQP
jgi:hypothetical protein